MQDYARRLHRLLCQQFPTVKVCERDPITTRSSSSRRQGRRKTVAAGSIGFRVDCPYCGDADQQLYIDARFGTYDPATGSDNLDLAVCLAFDCVDDAWAQKGLAEHVFANASGPGPTALSLPACQVSSPDELLKEVETPEDIVPIDQIDPAHPAASYLTSRGYDLGELSALWGVGYCRWSRFRLMRRRIYVPVRQDTKLVGWQGRWPGELDWGAEDIPKYFTMPGLRKSHLLYNEDLAHRQPLVVICEGVTDVWRVGPAAVALFGKTASRQQLLRLAAGWMGKPAVVLLDADAQADAEELAASLRPFFRNRLVQVTLPDGMDPGSCPRDELWDFLRAEAVRQGANLPAGTAAAVE
jgi:hypothetical protein